MKDTYYFSHDCGARNDPKILKLRLAMGWEGYGIFFAFVEVLREQANYKYPSKAKAELELCLNLASETLNQFLEISTKKTDLLIDDGEYIFSESLLRRMEVKKALSLKRSEAGRKGGMSKLLLEQNKEVAKQNISIAQPVKERKGKERKDKKEKIYKKKFGEFENVFLSDIEFAKLKNLFSNTTEEKIEKLSAYMASKGKQYKSHYATILAWSKNDNKNQPVKKEQTKEEWARSIGVNGPIVGWEK